ncbi:MAG: class I SAM-dependent methyltransferase [Chloroflexi bacterium]|nr:class I SAM-dependent methyltransferase [Chloroflexota bacterium]
MDNLYSGLLLDGKHYDQIHRDADWDLSFWSVQARKYGDPVLELACGTGRVANTLAIEGFRVTGIDNSDTMLSEARRKSEFQGIDVEWVLADVRHFELGTTFPLIIFPFRSIAALLTAKDLEACLSCVKKHLKAGGKFIIDAFNPDLDIMCRGSEDRYPFAEYPDPEGKGTIVVTQSNVYDAASQINRIKLFLKLPTRTEEMIEELNLRIYFPQELNALLEYNGFNIEDKFGDYEETYFDSSSKLQIMICSISP